MRILDLRVKYSNTLDARRGRRMTGSAGSAMDVLINAIAFFNRRRVREEDRRRFCSAGGSADDGKRWFSDGRFN